jgi:hypothetical protein
MSACWLILAVKTAINERYPSSSTSETASPSAVQQTMTRLMAALGKDIRSFIDRYRILSRPLLIEVANVVRIPLYASMIAVFLAAFDGWPYDFYVLVRVSVFATAILIVVSVAKQKEPSHWLWIAGSVGILFNPFLSLHLHKGTWKLIDLITLAILIIFRTLIIPPI